MRKQTKLVAVLSAAALLAIGASMTSFAKGWQKSDDGTWQYYDQDDNMVTGEWAKDGAKWFYLDDDGNMLTDSWVNDDYYVGDDGAMLVNQWMKTEASDSGDEPGDAGDYWFYFGDRGKKTTGRKVVNNKTYYFNDNGEMQTGWYQVNDKDIYYLGDEDQGWRTEDGWLWLEKPGDDDDIHFGDSIEVNTDDDEAWYYFGAGGKMYRNASKKRVNGKDYYFNAHGQMLYEWINNRKVPGTTPSNAVLDGNGGATPHSAADMLYTKPVEQGWRTDGWYEIDGSQDLKTDGDTDWYYFSDGKAKSADWGRGSKDIIDGGRVLKGGKAIYRAKIRVKASKNKYFCFDEDGRMKTGLQYIPASDSFSYFDNNGYIKTGKVSNVDEDNDSFSYDFNTKTGEGYLGVKDGYLYFMGKRLEADNDYKLYYVEGKIYLVNNKGKVQSSNNRTYDIEGVGDKLSVEFGNGNRVVSVTSPDFTPTPKIAVPEIQLYDNVYTYYNFVIDGHVQVDSNGDPIIYRGWFVPNLSRSNISSVQLSMDDIGPVLHVN